MRYFSGCSGVEAATLAWEPLGWEPVAFSEIESFPSAVLRSRWPSSPNLGDFLKHHEWGIERGSVDVAIAGTPCQPFSIAGLREGLADPRGNLTLALLGFLERVRPRWVVWENVTGVLSDESGAFGTLLTGLAKCGYGFAYRVLDSQFFGVPQCRRRVYLVACLGGWQYPAAVLFEPESLQRGAAGYRQRKRAGTAGVDICPQGGGCATYRMTALGKYVSDTVGSTLKARDHKSPTDLIVELVTDGFKRVRGLTPLGRERLQGFPDNHTQISWRGRPPEECPPSLRVKAIGNSMAVPVVEWIGRGIETIDQVLPR